jgi:hypothetical protein
MDTTLESLKVQITDYHELLHLLPVDFRVSEIYTLGHGIYSSATTDFQLIKSNALKRGLRLHP